MGSTVTAVLIVVALVSYLVAVALNAVFSIPGVSPFNQTIADVSHKYDSGITPSDATFGIWGLIYLWLLALLVYCQTLICRNSYGKPLYVDPGFIPSVSFFFFTISMIGNPAWIAVYELELIGAAAILLAAGAVAAYICLFTAAGRLSKCGAEMEKRGLTADIWCTRILVHNGFALYCAWVTCATVLNFLSLFIFEYGYSKSACCFSGLGVIGAVILAWFTLETFLLDRELRYVFAHYIAFLAALAGSYSKNYDPDVTYTKYGLALLVCTSVLATLKLIIIIVRSIKSPIHYQPSQLSKQADLKESLTSTMY